MRSSAHPRLCLEPVWPCRRPRGSSLLHPSPSASVPTTGRGAATISPAAVPSRATRPLQQVTRLHLLKPSSLCGGLAVPSQHTRLPSTLNHERLQQATSPQSRATTTASVRSSSQCQSRRAKAKNLVTPFSASPPYGAFTSAGRAWPWEGGRDTESPPSKPSSSGSTPAALAGQGPGNLVPRKEGNIRPVFNLRPLNNFIIEPSFRMSTMKGLFPLIQQND